MSSADDDGRKKSAVSPKDDEKAQQPRVNSGGANFEVDQARAQGDQGGGYVDGGESQENRSKLGFDCIRLSLMLSYLH